MSHFTGLMFTLDEKVSVTAIDSQVNMLEVMKLGQRVLTAEELRALLSEEMADNITLISDNEEIVQYCELFNVNFDNFIKDYDINKHTLWFCCFDNVTYGVRFDEQYFPVITTESFEHLVNQYGWTYSVSEDMFECTKQDSDVKITGVITANIVDSAYTTTGLKIERDGFKIKELVNAVSLV